MLRAPRDEAPRAGAGLPGRLPVALEGSPRGPGGFLWGRSRSRERAPVPGGSSAAIGAWPRLPPLQRLLKWRRGRRDPRAPPPPSRARAPGLRGTEGAGPRPTRLGREGKELPGYRARGGKRRAPRGDRRGSGFGERNKEMSTGGGVAEGTPWAWCLGAKSEVL